MEGDWASHFGNGDTALDPFRCTRDRTDRTFERDNFVLALDRGRYGIPDL